MEMPHHPVTLDFLSTFPQHLATGWLLENCQSVLPSTMITEDQSISTRLGQDLTYN